MIRTKNTYEEAYAFASNKARETGIDYRIIPDGENFIVGTERSIGFHFPNAVGYNVRHQA